MKQLEGEPIFQVAFGFRELWVKYLDALCVCNDDGLEHFKVECFVDALLPKLQWYVLKREMVSFDEAVYSARRKEWKLQYVAELNCVTRRLSMCKPLFLVANHVDVRFPSRCLQKSSRANYAFKLLQHVLSVF